MPRSRSSKLCPATGRECRRVGHQEGGGLLGDGDERAGRVRPARVGGGQRHREGTRGEVGVADGRAARGGQRLPVAEIPVARGDGAGRGVGKDHGQRRHAVGGRGAEGGAGRRRHAAHVAPGVDAAVGAVVPGRQVHCRLGAVGGDRPFVVVVVHLQRGGATITVKEKTAGKPPAIPALRTHESDLYAASIALKAPATCIPKDFQSIA